MRNGFFVVILCRGSHEPVIYNNLHALTFNTCIPSLGWNENCEGLRMRSLIEKTNKERIIWVDEKNRVVIQLYLYYYRVQFYQIRGRIVARISMNWTNFRMHSKRLGAILDRERFLSEGGYRLGPNESTDLTQAGLLKISSPLRSPFRAASLTNANNKAEKRIVKIPTKIIKGLHRFQELNVTQSLSALDLLTPLSKFWCNDNQEGVSWWYDHTNAYVNVERKQGSSWS